MSGFVAMQRFLLIVASIPTVFSTTVSTAFSSCPPDYTRNFDVNICYKIYTTDLTRTAAAAQCFADGAKLATIDNAYRNTFFATQASTLRTQLWIGLRCLDDNDYCGWDDDTYFGTGSYSNFYPNNPLVDIGQCVYLSANSNGRWLSADCDELQMGFACLHDIDEDPKCGGGYQSYGNMCYKLYQQSTFINNSEPFCVSDGGHLVSIHDQQENDFVSSLLNTSVAEARIGLYTTESNPFYQWYDGTPFTAQSYSNFGDLDNTKGLCVMMTGSSNTIGLGTGRWANTPCDLNQAFVCERKQRTG